MKFAIRNLLESPVSAEELRAFGVPEERLNALLLEINVSLCGRDPNARWHGLVKGVLDPGLSFELHRWLFDCVHCEHDSALTPPPAWIPSDEVIGIANVTRLAKSLGLASYEQLSDWAQNHRSDYWNAAIESLGISFVSSPKRIFCDGKWLPGARLNIVDSCFQADSERVAIVSRNEAGLDREITYWDLEQLVNRVANGIDESGLVPGDRIGIMMSMTVEAVAAYLGAIRAGCVPVAIAESFAPREIELRLKLSGAKAIFLADVICRAGKRLPSLDKFAVVDSGILVVVVPTSADFQLPSTPLNMILWQDFLSSGSNFVSVPAGPDGETNILFSSGTTGEPKAIPWTQTTPIKCAADGKFHQNIHENSLVAWPTSMGWMMGPWLIYATLINRGTMALYDGAPNSVEFCRFVQDVKVTMLGVVPSLVRAWKNHEMMAGLDWTAIETFSSTGECSNRDDMLFLMAQAGYRPVIEYCGGTEIGGGYLTSTVVQPNVPGCFSTLALGLGLVLEENEGELWHKGQCQIDFAVQGEVYLVGSSIGLSTRLLNADHDSIYFSDTPKVEGGPRLRRHGDELLRFPSGYFQACGRADDAMNLGGIKVSAVEIERLLNQLSSVRETAAIAVADGAGPAELMIFAVPFTSDLDVGKLKVAMQDLLVAELNPLFRIAQVELIESLPRTSSNKVIRRLLRTKVGG